MKLVLWSPELKAVIDEALALQRTSSVHVFGNTAGQVYTRSGWNTKWSRLMGYCEKEAQARRVPFERFARRDMRPAAVTDRQEEGDDPGSLTRRAMQMSAWCERRTIGVGSDECAPQDRSIVARQHPALPWQLRF
ncbi:TPA: hypothetical protein RJR38_002730 [Burkholderia multivorans]|nr:hypothetical protein [Burkholderia multivorans]